jgi:hypothetical protein
MNNNSKGGAHLVYDGDIVEAQFDEGKMWETHSRLHFPASDWRMDDASEELS